MSVTISFFLRIPFAKVGWSNFWPSVSTAVLVIHLFVVLLLYVSSNCILASMLSTKTAYNQVSFWCIKGFFVYLVSKGLLHTFIVELRTTKKLIIWSPYFKKKTLEQKCWNSVIFAWFINYLLKIFVRASRFSLFANWS